MAKYRKSDEYYHDQYDRHTIEGLKEYETLMGIKFNDEPKNLQDKMKQVRVQDYAIQSAREKRATIEGWKQKDEQRDRMIARHPVPMPPTCLCEKQCYFLIMIFLAHRTTFILSTPAKNAGPVPRTFGQNYWREHRMHDLLGK